MADKLLRILLSFMLMFMSFTLAKAQSAKDKTKIEIEGVLKEWNNAAKKANPDEFMSLYDSGADILLVGSDSGEIYKGRDQIKNWLSGLFKNNSFEWEMNNVYIDHYKNTAWVFVDGAMIVTNHEGTTFKTPYRFTGIMLKVHKEWKWRLFNGSIPQGE